MQAVNFPFEDLAEPLKGLCIQMMDKKSKINFRSVNRKYSNLVGHFTYYVVSIYDTVSIGGIRIDSLGYTARVRIIVDYFVKRKCLSNR